MTALQQQTRRGRPREQFASGKQIVGSMATAMVPTIGGHGAACCAFCQEVNISITAFTEACCAGTEASLALPLSNAGLIATSPLIELDAMPCAAGWPKNCGCGSTGFSEATGSLWYDTACGSLAPSQRRST